MFHNIDMYSSFYIGSTTQQTEEVYIQCYFLVTDLFITFYRLFKTAGIFNCRFLLF